MGEVQEFESAFQIGRCRNSSSCEIDREDDFIINAYRACLNVEPLARIRNVEVQVGGSNPGGRKKVIAHNATPRCQYLGRVLRALPAALRTDVIHIEHLADARHQLITDSTVEFVPCLYEELPQRKKTRIRLL